MADVVYSNVEENRFWLQMIGDYPRFLLDALSTKYTEEAKRAREFIAQFDDLLAHARSELTPAQISQLNQDAIRATQDFRKFALEILRRQLVEAFQISILPIVISHMVSSADLYLYILGAFIQNMQPRIDVLYLDTFWLPLFSVEAAFISCNVGVYIQSIKNKASEFSSTFSNQFIRAVENQGFSRIGVNDYPVALQFQKDVKEQMAAFAEFIVDLIKLILAKGLPGTINLFHMDHLYHQVCYFDTKLSFYTNTPKPVCDFTSPRLSNL